MTVAWAAGHCGTSLYKGQTTGRLEGVDTIRRRRRQGWKEEGVVEMKEKKK